MYLNLSTIISFQKSKQHYFNMSRFPEKCRVYPDIVNGIPVIKKPISEVGLQDKGGVTLFEFKSPLEVVQFLGKHEDIFAYNFLELKRFIKQNV